MLFKAQNHRELSFKKGDFVYIRRQVDQTILLAFKHIF